MFTERSQNARHRVRRAVAAPAARSFQAVKSLTRREKSQQKPSLCASRRIRGLLPVAAPVGDLLDRPSQQHLADDLVSRPN